MANGEIIEISVDISDFEDDPILYHARRKSAAYKNWLGGQAITKLLHRPTVSLATTPLRVNES